MPANKRLKHRKKACAGAHHSVDLVGGDARLDRARRRVERLPADEARVADALDLLRAAAHHWIARGRGGGAARRRA